MVAVVSPHFDDAVLSCGRLLSARSGSHVVTVFSSGPRGRHRLTAWDRMSGFSPHDDVIAARRSEDDAALSSLRAQGHRLGMRESQYRRRWWPARLVRFDPRRATTGDDEALVAEVAKRLLQVVNQLDVRVWLVPLGLLHPDHVVTAKASLVTAARIPGIDWIAYEDLPYGVEHPELVATALQDLRDAGWQTEEYGLPGPEGEEHKRAAVHCYRSQCAALGDRAELAVKTDERYHHLVRAPGHAGR